MNHLAKLYINKGFIYLLYFIIIFSSVLDYRLLPLGSDFTYARVGVLVFWMLSLGSLFLLKLKIRADNIFYVLLAYSFFKLLSVLYAINITDAFLSAGFWFSVSFLYLSLLNLDFKKYFEDIKTVIIFAGLFNAFIALLQAFLFINFQIKVFNIYGWRWPYGFRVTGLSFDANHLAAFVLLPLIICIDRFIKNRGKIQILYGVFVFVFFSTFYYSASRSGLIALLVGLLIYVFKYVFKYVTFKRLSLAFFGLVPVIFIMAAVLFTPLTKNKNTPLLKDINSVIFESTKHISKHGRGLDPSAFAHFALIYSSFYMQSANNFLGVGAGNFAEGLKQNPYLSKVFLSVDATVFQKKDFPAHSMYGEALAEGGFIGLVAFLSILLLINIKYLNLLKSHESLLPFFVYFYAMCFFMLFYNINEEFFWVFAFVGVNAFILKKADLPPI